MRPVNLLPDAHRPRRAGGALAGSAYVVVGALTLLLLAVGAYMLSANRAAEAEQKAAQADREARQATAQIAQLSGFTSFVAIKEARVQSVRQLAGGRFDWERLMRELALVLPDGVWLTAVDASVAPESSSATAVAGAAAGGPSADLTGCARRHPDVAALMVRLRSMDSVSDVSLAQSARTGSSEAGECARGTSFQIRVSFSQEAVTPATGIERVPASLGGGK